MNRKTMYFTLRFLEVMCYANGILGAVILIDLLNMKFSWGCLISGFILISAVIGLGWVISKFAQDYKGKKPRNKDFINYG